MDKHKPKRLNDDELIDILNDLLWDLGYKCDSVIGVALYGEKEAKKSFNQANAVMELCHRCNFNPFKK